VGSAATSTTLGGGGGREKRRERGFGYKEGEDCEYFHKQSSQSSPFLPPPSCSLPALRPASLPQAWRTRLTRLCITRVKAPLIEVSLLYWCVHASLDPCLTVSRGLLDPLWSHGPCGHRRPTAQHSTAQTKYLLTCLFFTFDPGVITLNHNETVRGDTAFPLHVIDGSLRPICLAAGDASMVTVACEAAGYPDVGTLC
jgi:hypothetical protein